MKNRILELANLIPNDSIVADIGCDHAYLIIELFKQNKIDFAYAIDNKDGPIKNAIKNINKFGYLDKCKIIKADGLNFIFDKKIDVLVFAGLGGYNVIDIINDNPKKLNKIKYIVTDIHRDNDKLTDFLFEKGYKIEKNIFVTEKKKRYNLLRYKNENI